MVEKRKKAERRDSQGQPVEVTAQRVHLEDKKRGSRRRLRVT